MLNYRQVIVASRAEAGRKSFDVARAEWAGAAPSDVRKAVERLVRLRMMEPIAPPPAPPPPPRPIS